MVEDPPRLARPLGREGAVIFQISDYARDLLETPFYLRGIRRNSFEFPTKSMPCVLAARVSFSLRFGAVLQRDRINRPMIGTPRTVGYDG